MIRQRTSALALILGLLGSLGLAQQADLQRRVEVVQTRGGLVTSNSEYASQIGCDIMSKGGNAVDGAIATAFALAVTWPEAGNIGGGGFMMIAPTDTDEVVCVDYRETAPAAANKMTFVNQKSRHDSRMVGVPGTVRGLALAHEKYGKLPWADLIMPAAKMARNGFVIDAFLAESINSVIRAGKSDNAELNQELHRVYGRNDNRRWMEGDTIQLVDLANTLDRIATSGPDEFYTGQTSRLLVDFMQNSGGLISVEDLRDYKAIIRPAIKTEFRGYQVFGAPPPSSAGITITLGLNILDELGFQSAGDADWNGQQMHLVAEAMRRAFRERAAHLGDSDFVEIPSHLTSKEFAKKLASSVLRDRATNSRDLAGEIALAEGEYESPNTTHFSVVDESGMAVSNTYTLEASWGARVIAPGTGAVLNNEMGDFNWYPGYTNLKGRIGTKANLVEPRKRMLSSMSPTIVKRDGKVMLATGSPGGRTIINTTIGILLQRLVHDRTLADAIDAPRFHHQWLPDELRIESRESSSFLAMVEELKSKGHQVRLTGSQGSAHSLEIDPSTGIKTGVADLRRGGRALATPPKIPAATQMQSLFVEARSVTGKPLLRRTFDAERFAKLDADLALAIEEANANPTDPHKLIWVGRRLGYLWRYHEAIASLSVGINAHPNVPHLYRHRGHRYITIRQFDCAIADLEKAAELIKGTDDEVEQDGAPNAAGIPTSTLHTNIWYHLGLAHYFKGDYGAALAAYENCLAASKNNDMKVATLDWMYMTLRRLNRDDDAQKLLEEVTPEMELIESFAYHKRLLLYKGLLKPTDLIPEESSADRDLDLATYGYGVGNWYLENGDIEAAKTVFQEVTSGKYWSAFGFIAAEIDLCRLSP